ncbi:cilia- and flagella-associated protein 251-like [Haliotis cracherodii]|uniref:cilia- and flagella-associated protein 251-like n=1 Tax=Haliotis cracherodii TaxID=6455 RepID=UPI0039EBD8F7
MAEEAQEIPKENDTDVQDTQESPKADVEAEKEAGQVPVAEITNQNQSDETDGPIEKEDGKGGEDETDNTAPEFAAQGDGGEDEPNDPKEEPVKDSDKETEDQTIPKTVAEVEEKEGTSQVAAAQGQAAEENPSEDLKPEDEEKAEPTEEQGEAQETVRDEDFTDGKVEGPEDAQHTSETPAKEERPLSSSTRGSKRLSPQPGAEGGTPRQSPPPGAGETSRTPPPPEEGNVGYPAQPPPTQADVEVIPDAPRLPSRERTDTSLEGTMSSSALNMVWSFGLNRSVPVLNLTDGVRKVIMYPCAHVGVLYDFHNNKQHILQGHANPITCTCVSEDKRWLVTGDKGSDSMVIIWDTYTGIPIQTLFDPNPEGGVVAVALTPDARYLTTLSASETQILSIWDWTIDGETPVCTAELNPKYGVQNYIFFNPDDIHFLVTNSESQVIFFQWEERRMEYYAPPLTDQDFNKPVGRYSQSIFQASNTRALTGTSLGNLVVWDNNQVLTKVVTSEQTANKKALKIIKLQDRGINVLTITDRYIVVGDIAGHVKFFDQSLKLIYWYQEFGLGPVNALSFSFVPEFTPIAAENTKYPPDATIAAKKFVIRDFVVGSSIAIFGNITADGTKVEVIHREHDASIHALAAHPTHPYLAIGSYSGLLKIWNYEQKDVMVSRMFDRGSHIRCCTYDPSGGLLAVGFTNGCVRVLDAITLQEEMEEPFHYARDAVTHIAFSHDSQYLATADAEYTVSVYKKESMDTSTTYTYMGRHRAHYKPIRDIMFGVQLDSTAPRLLSLGEDRVMVEYDLENSSRDNIRLSSTDRIEQSAVPLCMAWYPPITKEHFIVTADDQYKFKLYNTTTKMCRKTLLGPTYGTPVTKITVIPTKDEVKDKRYLAYTTEDKVGMSILPLTGNPHNSMALVAHPSGVANLTCSGDGRYLFTAGGADAAVHMWEVNINALEAQAQLGGEELIPFYGLLDGGRDGDLFAELEDYFYYAQIRSQSVNTMETRQVSIRIPLSEVPFVMRAMGFYPSEQEIEDMLNEVKFSKYVETGQYVSNIDLGDFIKLYVNHRPAFGLSPEKILWAFDTLGIPTDKGPAVERGELLEILQSKGEHMTEYELAEYLTTLMGFNPEGGKCELQNFDATAAGDLIDQNLPYTVTGEMFSKEILGFSMYDGNSTQPS